MPVMAVGKVEMVMTQRCMRVRMLVRLVATPGELVIVAVVRVMTWAWV
jgi:hypothetical protein